MKVTVLGAGAWGTALANHLAKRHDTLLWARSAALIEQLKRERENTAYLPEVPLVPALRCSDDLAASLTHAAAEDALCIIATPVAGVRALCEAMRDTYVVPKHLIWLCKGFEAETHYLPHQIVTTTLASGSARLQREDPRIKSAPAQQSALDINAKERACSAIDVGTSYSYGALSGPSFAREVALGLPAALTMASPSSTCCERVVQALHHEAVRIYTSDDVIGVEVGGAVKNVLAIATGIADGLALGLNARAALITRGLAEMTRLGVALGGRAQTFTGLSGLGDLILTATGDLSRNRTVGLQLARGQSLEQILAALGHVAEGVRCAQTVLALAHRYAVEVPITQAVCSILFEGRSPREAAQALLQRTATNEGQGR